MKVIKCLSAVVSSVIIFFAQHANLNSNEIITEDMSLEHQILPLNEDISVQNDIVDESKAEVVNKLEIIDEDTILDSYIGTITGYGADCAGCSGLGYLACHTKSGSTYSLIYNDIYYEDEEYGKLRILAAAHSKFPCGSVIDITTSKEAFRGIVLDTGATMRNAWNNNQLVWIDVAFKEEATAAVEMPIDRNVKYDILRYGWN